MASDPSARPPEPAAGDATVATPKPATPPSWATRYDNDDIFGPATHEFLAPPQANDEIGRLGNYRVLQVLGAGGMGLVFLAEDVQLKRRVALKVMRPETAAGTEAHERFLREARATAAIEHDHIIAIYHVGKVSGLPYLAMPLLQGETLDDRLKREGKLPIAEALRIARETALGLAAAHERGLIHRDIKPSNLWLENRSQETGVRSQETGARSQAEDRVKILDFGLARLTGDEPVTALTEKGAVLGTPAYMAPEQAAGDDVDARVDLFSLGCVVYQMLTGARPFEGPNVMSLLQAIMRDEPTPPIAVNPAVPAAASELVMKLLAKDPAGRPPSARTVAEALAAMVQRPALAAVPLKQRIKEFDFAGQTSIVEVDARARQIADSVPSDEPPPLRPARPWLLIAAGVGVLLLVAGTYGIYRWNRGDKQAALVTPPPPSAKKADVAGMVPVKVPDNYALEFDGKTSFVDIKRLENLEIFQANPRHPFTVEATVSAASHPVKIGNSIVHGLPLMLVHYSWEKNFWRVQAWTSDEFQCYRQSDIPMDLGKAARLAAVYDGKCMSLFVDGRLQQNAIRRFVDNKEQYGPTDFALKSSFPGPMIGAAWRGAKGQRNNHFHGIIDEVRVSKSARYKDDYRPLRRLELDADTLALYHFDDGRGDVLTDSTRHRHDGTNYGAKWVRVDDDLQVIARPQPLERHALALDGSSAYVLGPDLKYDSLQPWTLEVAAKPDALETRSTQGILVGPQGLGLSLDKTAGRFYWTLAVPRAGAASAFIRSDNDWYESRVARLAAVWNGKRMELFVDGKKQKSAENIEAPARTPMRFCLGARFAGALTQTHHFQGILAEARISKTARYANDYAPQQRLETDEHTLALYHCDEGQGELLKDSSGHGHNVTIVGAKWVRVDEDFRMLK